MGTIYPVQQAFNGGEISPLLTARADQIRYQTGALIMRNAVPLAQGPVTRRPGLRFMGPAKEQGAGPVRLVPFVFSAAQSRVLEFGPGYVRVWMDAGLVSKNGQPYEVASPYGAADIAGLRFAQSADVIYIASRNHPPRKLSRHADDDWRFTTPTFMPAQAAPGALTLGTLGTTPGPGNETYSYKVTAVSATTGEESLASPEGTITTTAMSSTYWVRVSWAAVPGAVEYRVYKRRYGVFGFIGRAVGGDTFFDDRNIGADTEDTVPEAKNPFTAAGEYPGLVFFWQQRLGFAGSDKRPLTVWLSQSAAFENLATSRPPQDDDGIEATLAGQRQNRFVWIEGDRTLCLGTEGGEWTLSGQEGGPVTPTSLQFQSHGVRGSEGVPAVRAGDSLLYVQRGGGVVREFTYSFERDGYVAPDLTLLTGVLRGRKVRAWAYQQSPHSIVWCVLDDGTLAALTFLREHDVVGWHRHDTDGVVEDVTVIPGGDATASGTDTVWMLVRRTVGGQERRHVERMAPFFDEATPGNAFFVDAGLSYAGAPVMHVTGLEHLEGREVAILADGYVMPPRAVTGGGITLDRAASVIHVGLPYITDIIPTRPEIPAQNGSTLTRVRKIVGARLRLYRSMGVLAGADPDHLWDVLAHDAADPTHPAFVTGDRDVTIDGGWTDEATVLVRVADPTPMTMLAIVYDVDPSATSGGQI